MTFFPFVARRRNVNGLIYICCLITILHAGCRPWRSLCSHLTALWSYINFVLLLLLLITHANFCEWVEFLPFPLTCVVAITISSYPFSKLISCKYHYVYSACVATVRMDTSSCFLERSRRRFAYVLALTQPYYVYPLNTWLPLFPENLVQITRTSQWIQKRSEEGLGESRNSEKSRDSFCFRGDAGNLGFPFSGDYSDYFCLISVSTTKV